MLTRLNYLGNRYLNDDFISFHPLVYIHKTATKHSKQKRNKRRDPVNPLINTGREATHLRSAQSQLQNCPRMDRRHTHTRRYQRTVQ
jgi:hypothetical protein